MSSKMRAGLIAGGFGAALDVARLLSPHLSGIFPDSLVLLLTLLLALLEFFCLGIFSGVLAAIWLDLEDYGHQFASGGFAGAIAALVVMASDTVLSFLLMLTPQDQADTVATQSLFSRASLTGQVISIAIVVVIAVLAALIYTIVTLVISGLTTLVVASGKNVQALQAILQAPAAQARPGNGAPGSPAEELGPLDPALLPYRRPEYSPFVHDQQPQVISPWQRRRLEREGKLPPEGASPDANKVSNAGEQGPVYRVYPPPKWRGPTRP